MSEADTHWSSVPEEQRDLAAASDLLAVAAEIEAEYWQRVSRTDEEIARRIGKPQPSFEDLQEYNGYAVRSAIQKAAAAGFTWGTERVCFELMDKQPGLTIELEASICEVRDLWAKHYGESDKR